MLQGIPTTRAGSVVTSDDYVTRDLLYTGNPIRVRALSLSVHACTSPLRFLQVAHAFLGYVARHSCLIFLQPKLLLPSQQVVHGSTCCGANGQVHGWRRAMFSFCSLL